MVSFKVPLFASTNATRAHNEGQKRERERKGDLAQESRNAGEQKNRGGEKESGEKTRHNERDYKMHFHSVRIHKLHLSLSGCR